ncbi:hypothetical protein HY468_01310, partial [Candidatus Roizmanbacteria bacterium]|nr:hypothetical protein [Candidatus Roizmanbacteria bacterium]
TSAASGDTVIIPNGVYYENLTINKSLTLKAQNPGKVTISGAVNPAGVTFQPEGTTPGLYYTTDITVPVVWVMQGDRSFYHYASLNELINFKLPPQPNGTVLAGPREGFYFDTSIAPVRLYVILPNNADPRTLPAGQKVEFNRDSLGDGITIQGGTALNPRKDITIEGLHLRLWFNRALYIRSISQNITVRDNYFEACQFCIYSVAGNNEVQHKGLLIERNEFSDKPMYDILRTYGHWVWNLFYGDEVFHVRTIHTKMGGVTVRNNFLHQVMDGIQILGQPGVPNPGPGDGVAPSYVHDNVVINAMDNPLELDSVGGHVSYVRAYHNFILDSAFSLSMTYRNYGELLVDHNIFYFSKDGLLGTPRWSKFAEGITGLPLVNMTVAHNTVVMYWNSARGVSSQMTGGGAGLSYLNSIFQNNIIQTQLVNGPKTYDYPGFIFAPENIALCDPNIDSTCDLPQAINEDPQFVSGGVLDEINPIDFHLKSSSPARDAGALVDAGMFANDAYAPYSPVINGSAPDLGAIEFNTQWTMATPGPSWARSYGDISSRPRLPVTLNASWIGFGGYVQPTPTPKPPTATPTIVSGDTNNDTKVNFIDLNNLITNFNLSSYNQGDFNQSGVVNILDLSILLSNWR